MVGSFVQCQKRSAPGASRSALNRCVCLQRELSSDIQHKQSTGMRAGNDTAQDTTPLEQSRVTLLQLTHPDHKTRSNACNVSMMASARLPYTRTCLAYYLTVIHLNRVVVARKTCSTLARSQTHQIGCLVFGHKALGRHTRSCLIFRTRSTGVAMQSMPAISWPCNACCSARY